MNTRLQFVANSNSSLALAIARCSVLSFFLAASSDPVDNILLRPKLRLLEVGEGAGEPRLMMLTLEADGITGD